MPKAVAVESAPSNVTNIEDHRERRVTIEQARILQHEGAMVKNSRFGKAPAEPRMVFACAHIVHWRPNTALPEINQYATVRPA